MQLLLFFDGQVCLGKSSKKKKNNNNNQKENKGHLSEDGPSSTVHNNDKIMTKVQVANSGQTRHDPYPQNAPTEKRNKQTY